MRKGLMNVVYLIVIGCPRACPPSDKGRGGGGVERSGTESFGRVSPFLLHPARPGDHYYGLLFPAACCSTAKGTKRN